jgi:hypothetical protein
LAPKASHLASSGHHLLIVQRCSPLPCTQGRGVGGEGFGENERTSASFSLTRPSPPTPLP